ncbi:MAG: carbohydrate ABC transporter permease [Treponema sp.]|jgi:multiple sugar transport system permease protein|nr:carbohydrate ABC transporter permease [Treponema sp.]
MTTNNGRKAAMLGQALLILFLTVLCLVSMLPFCWSASTSLRLPADSFKMPPSFFPTAFHYDNYTAVFTRFPFLRFITNSLFVSFMVMFLGLLVTTMAAYSFARIKFNGKNAIFMIFMAGLMIPYSATMISVYIIMSKIHLVGNLWALILPAAISPLHIFLVRQFMMTIPASYEEAAEIDGAGRLAIYLRIMMPMSKPVMMLAALQVFIGSWNNFIGPLIYLSDWDKMTLPIGLKLLQGYMGMGNISEILAGITVSLAMPVLLFLFGQRYLIEGIALTGVKS